MTTFKQLFLLTTTVICFTFFTNLPIIYSYHQLEEIIPSNYNEHYNNYSKNVMYNVRNSNTNKFMPLHQRNFFNLIDLNGPIKIMNYHRNMMNTFKVSNFIANQISTMLNIQNGSQFDDALQKRIGIGINNNLTLNADAIYPSNTSNHKFLNDVGSTEYAAWLNRLATSQYIRNYLQNNDARKTYIQNGMNNKIQPEAEDLSDLDDGRITGYGYLKPSTNDRTFDISYEVDDVKRNVKKNNINKAGYHFIHKLNHNQMVEHPSHYDNVDNKLKELKLKDVVAVAFTTLSFLSFGMIILQILMCITMNKDDINNNSMMMLMEGIDTDTEEIRRTRRSIEIHKSTKTIILMNEISRKILLAMAMYGSKENHEQIKSCTNTAKGNNQFVMGKLMQKLWKLFWKRYI